jgi:NADPH2:quinone reductase
VKAIVVCAFGGPEALCLEDVPTPAPGPGEVLLQVAAAGVNFADVLLRAGRYGDVSPPCIPGMEAAGTVVALGPGVDRFAVGDRVCGWVRAGYAELAVADAALLFRMPAGLGFADAAAFPTAFGTAWHALVTLSDLQPGQVVLILAVGSGVGAAALQVARQQGACPIGTSTQGWKLEQASALGCALTVDTTDAGWPARIEATFGPRPVDLALEGVGRATLPSTIACLADHGRIVVYGAPGGRHATVDLLAFISRNLSLRGTFLHGDREFPRTLPVLADQLLPQLAGGELSASVDRTLPLAAAAEAHRLLEARAVYGKLVLTT